jgi:hypothetical protein|tara:strand:+ start:1647 stop:1910 length:264 start_codon:yes stop_codon:yes gene_type:complete
MTHEAFQAAVTDLLDGTAKGKHYNQTGPGGANRLYEFVRDYVGHHPDAHALGEMIYKIVRFAALDDVKDIQKVSAWASLVAQHHSSS